MNDLLPPSATSQERAIAAATSRVSDVPVPIRTLWNAQTCPVDLLPWLAWALSVDTWYSNWTEVRKRAVIAAAVSTARVKGTKKSVSEALAALSASSVIVEWFQKTPVGTPHTFTINIVSNDDSIETQAAIAKEINRTKPVRSHYDIVFGTAGESKINVVGVFQPAIFVRLNGGATY
jgi:phage tail P2-like protein